jgi:ubiquinone/menaquinone biosynthesis C-methylase UbiE
MGRAQRDAVWRRVEPVFRPGSHILDLGCGTGEDALHFTRLGLSVLGVDASGEMARIARQRGVSTLQLPVERLAHLDDSFDGAISNFGALNCVQPIRPVARHLARLIKPGGQLAICLMGKCCAWEICHFLKRLDIKQAFRRIPPRGSITSLSVRVYYPSIRKIQRAFQPEFRLCHWSGIGLLVPPSYVKGVPAQTIRRLAVWDRCIAGWPVLRALADHRLLVFTRL